MTACHCLRRQAPCQRASPFFPEVHEELTRSWDAPYSAHLRASSSPTLTSVYGTEEKSYGKLPLLDESVAAHLYPPMAIGWTAMAAHPSKPCRITSALAGHLYSLAIHWLEKGPRRFTPWRSSRSSRPNSSGAWTRLAQTPQHSENCAARPTWLYVPPRPWPRRSAGP